MTQHNALWRSSCRLLTALSVRPFPRATPLSTMQHRTFTDFVAAPTYQSAVAAVLSQAALQTNALSAAAVECDSVRRKRRRMMNKHKYKKRLKKERHATRKSQT